MNKKIFFMLVWMILVFSTILISSQEVISLLDGQITGQGFGYREFTEKEISLGQEGVAQITFEDKNSRVKINDDVFENINPDELAYINIDENGGITKADFSVNEKGGTYVFGNTQIYAPPNSRIFFDKITGISMKVEDGSEFSKTPELTTQGISEDYIITIQCNEKCKSFNLPNGAIIGGNGRLGWKDGQFFVPLDDKVIVNGVELTSGIDKLPEKYSGEINLFFDGQGHKGDYASFDLNKRKLILSSETNNNFIANFHEDNPFLRIDEGDYVAVKPLSGGEIEIQNRDEQGFIPRVITTGNFVIDEDGKSIYNAGSSVYSTSRSILSKRKETSTSPIELFILDKNGKNRLGTGDKFFIDNFNRLLTVPDVEEITTLVSFETPQVPIKFSSRLKYNYPTKESIKALTGKEFIFNDVTEGNKDIIYGRLRDYWETLTQETKESFNKITITSNSYFDETYKGKWDSVNRPVERVGGFAGFDEIVIRSDNFDFSTFRHEAAHEYHYLNPYFPLTNIEEQEREDIANKRRELWIQWDEISDRMNALDDELYLRGVIWTETNEGRVLSTQLDKIKKELDVTTEKLREIDSREQFFNLEWFIVSGQDSYGEEGIGKLGEDGYWRYRENPKDFSPKHGFIEPYGTWNSHEDVATFVGQVNNPGIFAPLISPKSSSYDIRYRQKLDLLHKYKFISDDEYNKILETAGVK